VPMIALGVVTLHVPMIALTPVVAIVEDYVDPCVATLAALQVGKRYAFRNKRIRKELENRNCKKCNFYSYQGLPAGMQVLLLGRKKHQGTYDVGSGEGCY